MAKAQATLALVLDPRDAAGTTSAKALRKANKIPGVLYGHGSATPITVELKLLQQLLASHDRGHVVDASIGGQNDSVLLRNVEVDPVSRKPLSVDFQRVSRDEAVTANVTVHVTGTSPGVKDGGGVLDIVTHTLSIKGPSGRLPESIEVDVNTLALNAHITAGAITLPDGFALVTPADTVVVACESHRGGAEPSPAEAQPEPAPGS